MYGHTGQVQYTKKKSTGHTDVPLTQSALAPLWYVRGTYALAGHESSSTVYVVRIVRTHEINASTVLRSSRHCQYVVQIQFCVL